MKKLSERKMALIAMALTLISFFFALSSLQALFTEVIPDGFVGYSDSFTFWIYSVATAFCSLPFYLTDAIFLLKKAKNGIRPGFNTALGILLIVAIPMCFFVGGAPGITAYIWNAYYLVIFILEIVSLVQYTIIDW